MLSLRAASFLVLSVVSVVFSGCEDQEAPQCASPPWAQVQAFAACVSASSLDKGPNPSYAMSVQGKVIASGVGAPSQECSAISLEQVAGIQGRPASLSSADRSWFTVDGGKSGNYTVSLFRTGGAPLMQVGQELKVSSSNDNLEGVYDLVVDIRTTTSLVAWFGYLTHQMPPEATFAQGSVVCASEASCGTNTFYDLDVSIGSAQGSVPAGSTSRIGGFDVFLTSAVLYKETGKNCSYGAGGGSTPSEITTTAGLLAAP